MTQQTLPAWARPHEVLDLIRLALPVAASRSSFMLMALTDSVVLGRHAASELPLVLNAWLPIGVLLGLGMGLLMGVQVLTAEHNGSGRGEETGRIFRRGFLVSMIYGVLGTAVIYVSARAIFQFDLFGFDEGIVEGSAELTRILAYGLIGHMASVACTMYLEALRKPNIVTVISLFAVGFNLVFDLIVVPQYGAVGVAWATTTSRFLMVALFLVPIVFFTPALRNFGPGPSGEFRRQNMVGLGTGIANVAEWGSFNLTFVIATMVSIDAGIVYGLTVQMIGSIFMIYLGLGTATSVRVAEHFGRGNTQGVKDSSRLGIAATLVVGAALSALLWAFREPIAALALDAANEASEGAHLAPLLAAMIAAGTMVSLFDGLQGVGSMALRAREVIWAPTIVHVGAFVVLMVPLAAYWALPFGLNMGAWGVMWAVVLALGVAGVGQMILLEWFNRRPVVSPVEATAA